MERFEAGNGVACAQGDKGNLFLADDLQDIVLIGRLEHQIDPVNAVRAEEILGLPDFLPDPARGNAKKEFNGSRGQPPARYMAAARVLLEILAIAPRRIG